MVQKKYKKAIAEYLGVDSSQISLYWRGRVALYCMLKAFGVKNGDEVILPAFTCVVVPSAIKYLGATPVYVDIHPETFNIDVLQIEKKITSKTKIILAQNTFGLSADLAPILELAKKYNLKVIEDCAHGFGGHYQGKKNGTICHAAFFSTQWNKPFSTGIGGILLCNEVEYLEKINQIHQSLPPPSLKKKWMLWFQIFIKKNILRPSIYWWALKIYRSATEKGWISGSSDAGELDGPVMPKNYLLQASNVQARKGLIALKNFKKNLTHRKKIATLYAHAFRELGFPPISVPKDVNHTFLKYPFMVKDRNQFMAHAKAHRKVSRPRLRLCQRHPKDERR